MVTMFMNPSATAMGPPWDSRDVMAAPAKMLPHAVMMPPEQASCISTMTTTIDRSTAARQIRLYADRASLSMRAMLGTSALPNQVRAAALAAWPKPSTAGWPMESRRKGMN